jgi:uncharacterized protein (UPF0261 family)
MSRRTNPGHPFVKAIRINERRLLEAEESLISTILLIGTLDTKGEEYAYVAERLRARSHDVLVMNVGILKDPSMKTDISAEDVACAGDGDLAVLRAAADRGAAIEVMLRGACVLVPRLYASGRFSGVLGLGGGGGTSMITAAMRTLPVGVPKLMVSTMASGDTSTYVDVKDITLMYSVVDISGLNPLSRRILANAAGAIAGMVEEKPPAVDTDRKLIAATMFGVTTPCVTAVRQELERAGYDVLVFHATGSGGRAMEGLIDDGYFAGVVDITTTEWCDEVVGGVLTAGPARLSAAGRRGVPQVVSLGALDMVNFGAPETLPAAFRQRRLYRHNPSVTLMRTSPEECTEIGRRIAGQLNRATGPTVLMMPLRGVSMIDAPGQPFHDPTADSALFSSLRKNLRANVEVVEIDAHINDPEFSSAVAARMLRLLHPEKIW